MLTIERVIALKDVVKWNTIFGEAGLNANTMRSAMHYRRPLRDEEAAALTEALRRRGLRLTSGPAQKRRDETSLDAASQLRSTEK